LIEERVLPLWRRATGQQPRPALDGPPGPGIVLPPPGMAEAGGG
jgi:hypothetical protein